MRAKSHQKLLKHNGIMKIIIYGGNEERTLKGITKYAEE